MLGKAWNLSVNNNLSVTAAVLIIGKLWKFDSTGALVWSAEKTLFNSASMAASATTWTSPSDQDNTTDKYLGADLVVTVTPTASTTGTVTVQLIKSTVDTGSNYPTGGYGEHVGAVTYSAASGSARSVNMTID